MNMWVVLLLGLLLFYAWDNGYLDNVLNTTPTDSDPLVQSCFDAYEECKEIGEMKYGDLSISYIAHDKFEDYASAEEFWEKWRSQGGTFYNYFSSIRFEGSNALDNEELVEKHFPIVLIALKKTTRINGQKTSGPFVIGCDNTGQLKFFGFFGALLEC